MSYPARAEGLVNRINTAPQPPYSPDLAHSDFWLFPKLRGCRYETIEEMEEAVTKVIDTLTQEDLHGAFQKLLERYQKCIAAGGDYFEVDYSFMCVLSIKVPIQKSLETYTRILVTFPIFITHRTKRGVCDKNRHGVFEVFASIFFFLLISMII